MKETIGRESDAALFSAWECFVKTGSVNDYLNYRRQEAADYAGDSQRTGDTGKDTQQR